MKATVDLHQFRAGEKQYVEIFFYVVGNSVANPDSASVRITYYIEKDTAVVAGDRYNLIASEGSDGGDFMDIRRHYLSPGEYTFTAQLMDNRNPGDVVILNRTINVEEARGIGFSDLQLLSKTSRSSSQDKWTKHGLTCIPLPFAFYSREMMTLTAVCRDIRY